MANGHGDNGGDGSPWTGFQARASEAATRADAEAWVREARRIADTATPDVRAGALYSAVRAFYDSLKFSAVYQCPDVDEKAMLGQASDILVTLDVEATLSWHRLNGGR